MEDRLEVEEQITQEKSKHFQRQEQLVATATEILDSAEDPALNPEVMALIERCIKGTEPFDTEDEKKYYHNQKLTQQNVQAVMMKSAGFRNVEIAQVLGLDPFRMSVTLSHPYSRKILRAMRPAQVGKVIDIRTKMEQYAADLMDQTFLMATKSTDLKEVKDVTFGFLDRAGYNPVNKAAVAHGKPSDFLGTVTETTADKLANALAESNFVDSAVMPAWSAPKPPEESSSLPTQAEMQLLEPTVVGREVPSGPVTQAPVQSCSPVLDVPTTTQSELRSASRRSEPGE